MTLETAVGGLFTAGALISIAMLLAYFSPTFTAYFRKNPNIISILLMNLLLGWTFIGWGIALIWAFRTHNGQKNNSPLLLLQERYAKGEITEEEYNIMKNKFTVR